MVNLEVHPRGSRMNLRITYFLIYVQSFQMTFIMKQREYTLLNKENVFCKSDIHNIMIS